MIQTNEYELTIGEHFKILLLLDLKKNWLAYLIFFSIGVYYFDQIGDDKLLPFIGFLGFFYPIYKFIFLLNHVNSFDNKNLYLKNQLVINSDKIVINHVAESLFDTSTINEVAINHIIKKYELNKFWLLYLAKNQFLVIPKRIFKSEDDYLEFRTLLSI